MATGTPIAELILQDVETTLAAITEGPDFFTTINRVDRIDAGFPEVREPPQIFVGLGPTEMSDAGDNGAALGLMTHFLNLELQLFIRGIDDVALKLQRAIRDVVHALKADESRGGCALRTEIVRAEPVYPADIGDPIAMVVFDVRVFFRTSRLDLHTAA